MNVLWTGPSDDLGGGYLELQELEGLGVVIYCMLCGRTLAGASRSSLLTEDLIEGVKSMHDEECPARPPRRGRPPHTPR